jgi:hypothetical protein
MWGWKSEASLLLAETSVLKKTGFRNKFIRESLTLSDLKKTNVLKHP